MNKIIKISAALIIISTMLVTSGCLLFVAGAAAGGAVAGTAYYKGKLEGTMNATPPEVRTATLAAFKKLNIALRSDFNSEENIEIVGNSNIDGSTVSISADLNKDNTSDVSIRIGTFGDRDESQKIFDTIESNLK